MKLYDLYIPVYGLNDKLTLSNLSLKTSIKLNP